MIFRRDSLVMLLCITVIAIVLALGDPSSSAWPLKCPLFTLTGLQCPLCGMQRMCHSLLHLDFTSAYIYNKVLLITLPYWLLGIAGQLVPRWQRRGIVAFCYRDSVIAIMLAILVIWGIVRNL